MADALAADFDDNPTLPVLDPKGKKRKADGIQREYLKVFETLPPQLLNAYGQAAYTKQSDEEVWRQLCVPQKSGAKYMTELCSKELERRGIGINRFIHAVVEYIKYQETETTKKHPYLYKTRDHARYILASRLMPDGFTCFHTFHNTCLPACK